MKRNPLRQSARRLTQSAVLAAAVVTTSSSVAQAAPALDSTQPSVIDAEKFYDAEFDEYVDLRLFGVAYSTLDAKLMTDVGLQLREAESVLGRKHPQVSSNLMLEFAAKMASEGKDSETVDRLIRAAKAADESDRVKELEQMKSLVASSRDLRDDAMFSAMDVERGALAAFANLTLQIRAAELSRDKQTLESLSEAIGYLESLREPHRKKLYGLVDDAKELIGDSGKDKTADILRALTGVSRGVFPGVLAVAEPVVPPRQRVLAATVTMSPSKEQVEIGAVIQKSFVAGGMKYLVSPAGSIVQSYGRLGSILFEPGDVIVSIGGVPVGYGMTVDSLVNASYLSGDRRVAFRDRNSGRVLTLFF